MTVFALSDVKLHIDEVFACADIEGLEAVCNDDGTFYTVSRSSPLVVSSLDVPGVNVSASTADIIDALHETRGGMGNK